MKQMAVILTSFLLSLGALGAEGKFVSCIPFVGDFEPQLFYLVDEKPITHQVEFKGSSLNYRVTYASSDENGSFLALSFSVTKENEVLMASNWVYGEYGDDSVSAEAFNSKLIDAYAKDASLAAFNDAAKAAGVSESDPFSASVKCWFTADENLEAILDQVDTKNITESLKLNID